MTPRTVPPAPLDDRSYWRRLKAAAHPDTNGGDGDLFVFLGALEEHVRSCGALSSGKAGTEAQAPPPPRPGPPPKARAERSTHEDRKEAVPFGEDLDHDELTAAALSASAFVDEPYASLLRLLADCVAVYDGGPLEKQQRRGSTYKQLAAVGHTVGMSGAQRVYWYDIARDIPLSRRHAGHILSKLKRAAA